MNSIQQWWDDVREENGWEDYSFLTIIGMYTIAPFIFGGWAVRVLYIAGILGLLAMFSTTVYAILATILNAIIFVFAFILIIGILAIIG